MVLDNSLLCVVKQYLRMPLFTNNRYPFLALDKHILEIVELHPHPIYIIDIEQEWCICRNHVERNIANRSRYGYDSLRDYLAFSESNRMQAGCYRVEFDYRVQSLQY